MMYTLCVCVFTYHIIIIMHNIAASEKYECLQDAFEPVLDELNELLQWKQIAVKGKVVLGLNAANSNYTCPICEVHSRDRWDTSIDASEYNGDNVRKLSVMKTKAAIKATKKNADSKKGCVNMPLINIEPCDCIIDELYLFLRITDKLFDSFLPRWLH